MKRIKSAVLRLISSIFTVVIIMMLLITSFNTMPIFAYNGNMEETTDLDINKSLETNENADHLYNIVFSLPTVAQVEPIAVDIVFVMDQTSIANYSTVKTQINDFLDRMVENDAVNLNIGVIRFALDIDKSATSLTDVTPDNLATVKNMFNLSVTAGSNMYGGILAGKELLETGSAAAENKYLIIASDFGGYKSDAGDGKGLSFFYNYSYGNQGVDALHNNNDFHSKYYSYSTIEGASNFFTVEKIDDLIRNKVLLSGTSVSDETKKYLVETGSSVGEYPDNWRNPYASYGFINHTWTAEEKATLITNSAYTQMADFPTAFEKNIYLSGNEFLEMKQQGYNVIAVTSPYQPEDGSAYKRKFNATSNAFKDWFEQNIGERYETTENETFVDMLDDLESDLTYLVGKGEIVDVVAPEFAVVSGYETVTLNGIELAKTVLDNGDIAFGSKNNGVYPYVYHYEKIDDEEVITW